MSNPPESAFEAEEPQPAAPERKSRVADHAVAGVLFLVAIYFFAVFLANNELLWRRVANGDLAIGGIFHALFQEFTPADGAFEWRMFAWSCGAVAVFGVIGWFFLECLELYIPRSARAALSYLIGMGIAGFLFELLAMAGRLYRLPILVSLAGALACLWPLAARAARRKPESWGAGEGGEVERRMRLEMAAQYDSAMLVCPQTLPARLYRWCLVGILATISFTIFYHALLFPEVYWDSLILYLGYARMMFHEHGIVRKVVGQVGIGLGANYPHLFSLLGAGVTVVAGEWSELPQRLMAPLAGLSTCILVYHMVLRLTRNMNFALAVTVLYRAVPLGIAYDQYASDYALTMLFAAAFLYLALLFIETGLSGYFIAATAVIALSMHLNFLMGILWLPWMVMILLAHWRMPHLPEGGRPGEASEEQRMTIAALALALRQNESEEPPAWTYHPLRRRLADFLASPLFIGVFAASVAVGSTWFVRNWIVTGNPVYAFFYKIFGGININPEVMESSRREWIANGAGIMHVDGDPLDDSFAQHIAASWNFFVDWRQSYSLQPLFVGFTVTSFLVLLGRSIAALFNRGRAEEGSQLAGLRYIDTSARFGAVLVAMIGGLFGYHYIMAPFYLYQIICILPSLAVVVAFSYPYWRMRGWRLLFGAVVLATGIAPGIAMGLMGFKLTKAVRTGPTRVDTPLGLFSFRHPLPTPETFYRWQYGDEAIMWQYINKNLRGQKILTHENRHLVFDPSVEIVQIDDWAMQQLWPRRPADKVRELKRLGIRHYLFVPNERNHFVTEHMGARDWERLGLASEVFRAGDTILYVLR